MKVGLALSGGGARGFAHLGLAQALAEHDIKIDVISGTSAGAIVGAFLAAGYKPNRVLEIISELNLVKYFRPALTTQGLVKLERIKSAFEDYFPEDSFSALTIPLHVAVTNFSTGTSEHFHSGKLIDVVIASSSIPVIFQPVKLGEHLYVDGGILNNLPVNLIEKKCDFMIAHNCNPVGPFKDGSNMKGVLERSLLMAINQNSYLSKQKCDIFLEPSDLSEYKVFSLSKAKEMYTIGYETALTSIQKDEVWKAIL